MGTGTSDQPQREENGLVEYVTLFLFLFFLFSPVLYRYFSCSHFLPDSVFLSVALLVVYWYSTFFSFYFGTSVVHLHFYGCCGIINVLTKSGSF